MADFAMSQSLVGEAEDLYAGMQKFCGTVVVPLGGTNRDGTIKCGLPECAGTGDVGGYRARNCFERFNMLLRSAWQPLLRNSSDGGSSGLRFPVYRGA